MKSHCATDRHRFALGTHNELARFIGFDRQRQLRRYFSSFSIRIRQRKSLCQFFSGRIGTYRIRPYVVPEAESRRKSAREYVHHVSHQALVDFPRIYSIPVGARHRRNVFGALHPAFELYTARACLRKLG